MNSQQTLSDSTPKKTYAIVGLGATGLSCARFLTAQQIPFYVTDSREVPPQGEALKQFAPDTPCSFGALDEGLIDKADCFLISPGLAPSTPFLQQLKRAGKLMLNDVALFANYAQAPLVGITGSNGKGTVTTWLAHMIAQAGFTVEMGGNIGIPVLDLLAKQPPDFYVLELSSFQLAYLHKFPLKAAALLNVSPDHLDYHGSMADYLQAKQRIFQRCDHAVLNGDDASLLPKTLKKEQTVFFSTHKNSQATYGLLDTPQGLCLARDKAPVLSVDELAVVGPHNWANALAAMALADAITLPEEAIVSALRSFRGLAHRCELVMCLRGVAWYNDSKGTNLSAVQAAIAGVGEKITGRVILIAGGQAKGAEFTPLAEPVARWVCHGIFMGEAASQLQQTLQEATTTHLVASLADAVQKAHALARPGDAVLLSPACASFDMFSSYEERGQTFVTLVEALARSL